LLNAIYLVISSCTHFCHHRRHNVFISPWKSPDLYHHSSLSSSFADRIWSILYARYGWEHSHTLCTLELGKVSKCSNFQEKFNVHDVVWKVIFCDCLVMLIVVLVVIPGDCLNSLKIHFLLTLEEITLKK